VIVSISVQSVGLGSFDMSYCAAFWSSTPSILTREVLGFVFRLPRWYERCFPLTYTVDVGQSRDSSQLKLWIARSDMGRRLRLWPVPTAIVTVLIVGVVERVIYTGCMSKSR
jgi:hypothetical protein